MPEPCQNNHLKKKKKILEFRTKKKKIGCKTEMKSLYQILPAWWDDVGFQIENWRYKY